MSVDSQVMSTVGAKVIGALVIGGGVYATARYIMNGDLRRQRELLKQKVKFNQDNIPHFTIEKVKEYADKYLRGELVHWGSTASLPLKAYNIMVEKRMKAIYWHPGNLVNELYSAMKGANFPIASGAADVVLSLIPGSALMATAITGELDPRNRAYQEVLKLNVDQLRYLHNYWIENSSDGYSFYDWIDGEWTSGTWKEQLLGKLSAAGVGQFVNKNL